MPRSSEHLSSELGFSVPLARERGVKFPGGLVGCWTTARKVPGGPRTSAQPQNRWSNTSKARVGASHRGTAILLGSTQVTGTV